MKSLFIAVLLLFVAGCTTTQVADNAQAASALLDLRITYDQVKADLSEKLDELPAETGAALLDLQDKTDRYVQALTIAWKAGLTPEQIDRLYLEGRSLYLQGEDLLLPLTDTLPPSTWALLARFQQQAQVIDTLYASIMSGDEHTQELIRAGIALATLALKVGMMTL